MLMNILKNKTCFNSLISNKYRPNITKQILPVIIITGGVGHPFDDNILNDTPLKKLIPLAIRININSDCKVLYFAPRILKKSVEKQYTDKIIPLIIKIKAKI